MKYAFIESERQYFAVKTLCRVLGVPEQGYYFWRNRGISPRKQEEAKISAEIRIIHAESRRTYGSPRVYEELKENGRAVGRHRVARLMRQEGLRAKAGWKFRVTTDSSHGKPPAPDLVKRDFKTSSPNQVWVGDITYLWTDEGWMYLAVFIDLYSRMIVGWALEKRIDASLVTKAFSRACMRRRPDKGLIVHTDRGSQYASETFKKALQAVHATPSMGRLGNCWDNAVAESFFHSFKVEAIYGMRFETRRKMEYEVFDYIERFYNRHRRHSTIGSMSPCRFEEINSGRAAA